MKTINQYIQEKLFVKKGKKYAYFPKDKNELKDILKQLIEERGNNGDFNDIDTSKITNMSALFKNMGDFNGDISGWNVSNVTNMYGMFCYCKSFNCDLSEWDVSNVEEMCYMFFGCKNFNQPLNKWNVSKVIEMENMFNMFGKCPIEEKNKPNFK